jgi:hypothetical protein
VKLKKITLLYILFAFSFSGLAQKTNPYHESRFERAKIFAQVAADEFGLTTEQQNEVYTRKLRQFEVTFEAKKKLKRGEITKEESKLANKKFNNYFKGLTGKKFKELKYFYEKVHKEITKNK